MRRTRRRSADNPTVEPPRGVEFGWKVHAAQEAWTGKVDTKAAIVFTIQLALIAALLAAHGQGGLIARMHGLSRGTAESGTVLMVLGILFSGAAVVPRLGRPRGHKKEHDRHLIYFGHLRHWEPTDLHERLRQLTADEELEQLSRQLVHMSRGNWAKHRHLQAAMILTIVSASFVGMAAIMSFQ